MQGGPERPKDAGRSAEELPEAVRDIVQAVERAEKGDILFMHDIVGKRDAERSAHLSQQRHEAAGYVEGVKRALEHDDSVKVLGWEELETYGMREGSQNSREVLRAIAEQNPGKKIVLDFDPLQDKSIAPRWNQLEDSMAGTMHRTGPRAEGWLRDWLVREQKNQHQEGDPTKEEMEAGCEQALSAMRRISSDLKKGLHRAGGNSPLALALIVFAAKGTFENDAFGMFDRPHRTHEAVEFIKVDGATVEVSFAGAKFTRTLVG